MSRGPASPPKGRSALVLGGLFTLAGIGIVVAMTLAPEGLEVPYWVGVAAASAFSFAGLSVIAQALGFDRIGRWLALGVIAGLATPGLWILLDPAEKHCTASVGAMGGGSSFGAGDFVCRAVFGFGGALTLLVGVVALLALLRRSRRQKTGTAPRHR